MLLFFITHPLAKSSMNELRMKEMKEEKEMGLFLFKVVVNRTYDRSRSK